MLGMRIVTPPVPLVTWQVRRVVAHFLILPHTLPKALVLCYIISCLIQTFELLYTS